MSNECVGSTNIPKASEADLRDDRTELARGSRDTMGGRTITSGEGFTGHHKGGGVGAEVLEEVGQAAGYTSVPAPIK